MAYQITIPFVAFRIHFQSGEQILIPLTDKSVLRVGQSFEVLAGRYAEVIQTKLLNKGKLQQLLRECSNTQFTPDKLRVSFAKAKDEFSHPAFELEFDYFFSETPLGVHGIVPALGVEAFAAAGTPIVPQLQESIRIEFNRKKRLAVLQQVVSVIWFEQVELLRDTLALKAPSPAEVEVLEKDGGNPLLPKVAQLLEIDRQMLYGMTHELEQLLKALKNRFNRSILLVGPSGVGKTTLVWELARQQSSSAKAAMDKKQIWETTASTLIKELTGDTGAWENNAALLVKELTGSDHILFVRNLMELFEVGQYSGNDGSLADFLRNPISRGELILIAECTEEELARIEIRRSNFLSHFQIIRIAEPKQNLEQIILQKVKEIAAGWQVAISEDAIQEVIRLHRRFVPYAGMPGRPIRFLESMLLNKKQQKKPGYLLIGRSEVVAHFCEETGMPLFMVDPAVPMNVRQVKIEFHNNIFGQHQAVESVVNALTSVKAALARTGKPIASFLFAGPTGVGKTELAKVLAQFMFGNRQKLVRFDMSEFSDPYAVLRLIGADYFSEGLLTSAVRREPFCVLLFDEIEKANPAFYDLLLQILGEGRLTDNQGKVVNFCSTIIIMTSNIGADSLQGNRIGWTSGLNTQEVAAHFRSAVQRHFRPELYNRMDEVIAFEPLDADTIRFVVERELQLFRRREGIRYRRLDLNIGEEVLDFIGAKGYHPKYGARYLQRVVREELVLPLAKMLNTQDPDEQIVVQIVQIDNQLQILVQHDPLGLELLIEELEKMNQANHASTLRRQIASLQEGNFYGRLLLELDALEVEKKHKKFWQNTAKVNQYTDFLQVKSKIEELKTGIEDLERSFGLSSLGQQPYQPQLADQLEHWVKDFFTTKIQLYSALTPQESICFFAIYGTNPEPVVDFYKNLFEQKKYVFTMQSVWFREDYYNEEVTSGFYDEANEYVVESREKREEYIKLEVEPDSQWKHYPEQPGDRLYGVEFNVFGAAACVFLKAEAGVQRWKLSEEFDHTYVVLVQNELFATPKNLHRRDFYTATPPRRVYEPSTLRDTVFRVQRELNRQELPVLILEQLEMLFNQHLDAAILWNE